MSSSLNEALVLAPLEGLPPDSLQACDAPVDGELESLILYRDPQGGVRVWERLRREEERKEAERQARAEKAARAKAAQAEAGSSSAAVGSAPSSTETAQIDPLKRLKIEASMTQVALKKAEKQLAIHASSELQSQVDELRSAAEVMSTGRSNWFKTISVMPVPSSVATSVTPTVRKKVPTSGDDCSAK